MNTWQTAVECVTDCLRAGVREFVVCAGARNAALVEALARAEAAGRVKLWRHFEERSAGFFALGRTMETGQPCAVVTTSGTAVAELLPAAIEAFYQARPLVAVTADRPAVFRGSGAPQTIEQPGIFGVYACDDGIEAWDGKRPLHVNVELDEDFEPDEQDLTTVAAGDFAPVRERLDVSGLARWLREDLYRGLVVMLGGLEPEDREEVWHFCHDLAVPVVADAASGLREALGGLVLHDADRVLKAKPPGKILRLGEVPGGRFWRDLENLAEVSVWSACRNGLPGLARDSMVTHGSPSRVVRALGGVDEADDALDLLRGNSARAARIEELLECYPDSEPAMVRAVSHFAVLGDGVFLGNSLPVREWNLFAQWSRPIAAVRANRGANGIDGQVSTWLGWSAGMDDSWALLGDLTALYDAAAPFVLGQLPAAKRTLAVMNNHGGRIFERLPRLSAMSPRAAECLTNPHDADLAGLAKLWGIAHLRVRTADDFDALAADREGALLLELAPDARQTEAFWREWDRMRP
jgi:2-succinyl-5-enolpyruvyl-6-hydroxy-3-cyclohexene-1-carboxylate synthase